jgi:hypothetical protein
MTIKAELMTRYATAKLASYMKKLGGEHEAKVATQIALLDAESDYKQRARNCSEAEALAVLQMDVEDAEKAVFASADRLGL